jgi:diguanylate cyclase (GGDEF)-like protein
LTEILPADGAARPRVLLLGDASARPDGLERALVRAGLAVDEGDRAGQGATPDLLLIIVRAADGALRALLDTAPEVAGLRPPRTVLIAGDDPGAPARALAMGADEALTVPARLGEFVARVAARIGRTVELPSRTALARRRDPDTPGDVPHDQQRAATAAAASTAAGTRPSSEELDARVREELERARRYALSFSLALIDVDQLVGQGDDQESGAADRLLGNVGDVLRSGLRVPDFVSRYAGGEFAVLLPETSLTGARQSVARARERLAAHAFEGVPSDDRPRITAGIVTFPHPAAEQIDDLFALAEAALLRARHQAGDGIATAESAAP